MKIKISIPKSIFYEVEECAKTLGISRSQLYAVALEEYLKKRRRDNIRSQINEVLKTTQSVLAKDIIALQAYSIPFEEW